MLLIDAVMDSADADDAAAARDVRRALRCVRTRVMNRASACLACDARSRRRVSSSAQREPACATCRHACHTPGGPSKRRTNTAANAAAVVQASTAAGTASPATACRAHRTPVAAAAYASTHATAASAVPVGGSPTATAADSHKNATASSSDCASVEAVPGSADSARNRATPATPDGMVTGVRSSARGPQLAKGQLARQRTRPAAVNAAAPEPCPTISPSPHFSGAASQCLSCLRAALVFASLPRVVIAMVSQPTHKWAADHHSGRYHSQEVVLQPPHLSGTAPTAAATPLLDPRSAPASPPPAAASAPPPPPPSLRAVAMPA